MSNARGFQKFNGIPEVLLNHPRDSGTLLYKVIMMSFDQWRRCFPPRED